MKFKIFLFLFIFLIVSSSVFAYHLTGRLIIDGREVISEQSTVDERSVIIQPAPVQCPPPKIIVWEKECYNRGGQSKFIKDDNDCLAVIDCDFPKMIMPECPLEKMSLSFDECESRGGKYVKFTDDIGCSHAKCNLPIKQPIPKCPTDENNRYAYDKCINSGGEPRKQDKDGCIIVDCDFEKPKCPDEKDNNYAWKKCKDNNGVPKEVKKDGCWFVDCKLQDQPIKLPDTIYLWSEHDQEKCIASGGVVVSNPNCKSCPPEAMCESCATKICKLDKESYDVKCPSEKEKKLAAEKCKNNNGEFYKIDKNGCIYIDCKIKPKCPTDEENRLRSETCLNEGYESVKIQKDGCVFVKCRLKELKCPDFKKLREQITCPNGKVEEFKDEKGCTHLRCKSEKKVILTKRIEPIEEEKLIKQKEHKSALKEVVKLSEPKSKSFFRRIFDWFKKTNIEEKELE